MRKINLTADSSVKDTKSRMNIFKPSFNELGFSVDQIMALNENMNQVSFLMK